MQSGTSDPPGCAHPARPGRHRGRDRPPDDRARGCHGRRQPPDGAPGRLDGARSRLDPLHRRDQDGPLPPGLGRGRHRAAPLRGGRHQSGLHPARPEQLPDPLRLPVARLLSAAPDRRGDLSRRSPHHAAAGLAGRHRHRPGPRRRRVRGAVRRNAQLGLRSGLLRQWPARLSAARPRLRGLRPGARLRRAPATRGRLLRALGGRGPALRRRPRVFQPACHRHLRGRDRAGCGMGGHLAADLRLRPDEAPPAGSRRQLGRRVPGAHGAGRHSSSVSDRPGHRITPVGWRPLPARSPPSCCWRRG